MKKHIRILSFILCALILFGSCGTKEESEGEKSDVTTVKAEDLFEDADFVSEYDENGSIVIELKGDSVVSSSDSVKISGTTVTITEEASYIISGNLSDGMIIVDAGEKDKPQLVFDGVDITSKTSAALYILEADKVIVTLNEKTENSLINGGSFAAIDDNNIDAAVFSKKDITFNGGGTLNIESPAGHGISAKDDFVITGGCYSVTSSSHAIDVNDSVKVSGASLTLNAGKDGIHCENTEESEKGYIYIENGSFDISAEGDGISSSNYTQIDNGVFDIISGGGSANASQNTSENWGSFGGGFSGFGGRGGGLHSDENEYQYTSSLSVNDSSSSIKGIKTGADLNILGGEFTLDCADDALHSNSSMAVSGGSFDIKCGDDGFHADADLEISDGKINISESYEGIEALNITVSGGDITLVASDDGLNAAGGSDESGFGGFRGNDMFGGGSSSGGSILISGGNLTISADGDGIDSNGSLDITGGIVNIDGPTSGDTSTLDYTTNGTITGGTFIGTGGVGMNMCFDSSSKQGAIMVSVSGNEGSEISLADSQGNILISHTAKRAFNCIILSSAEISAGESYILGIDGQTTEITMSSIIYNGSGSSGMGGMGGNMPGGMGGGMHGGRPF